MKKRVFLVCLVLLCGLNCFAQSGSLTGTWRGIWTNPAGLVFSAEMTLDAGPGCKTCAVITDGSVRGRIVWTLRKAGSNSGPEFAGKVGTSETELVKGEMKGDGLLVLNGYDRDDLNSIKGIDQYRLAISDNGKVIGGITLNHGPWTGQFIAMKVEP